MVAVLSSMLLKSVCSLTILGRSTCIPELHLGKTKEYGIMIPLETTTKFFQTRKLEVAILIAVPAEFICPYSVSLSIFLYYVHEDTIKVSTKSRETAFISCGHPKLTLHTDLWIFVCIHFAKTFPFLSH